MYNSLKTFSESHSLSHQFPDSVFFLHFLLQLSEALLHALMKRSQVVSHPLPMQSDPPAQQGNLQVCKYSAMKKCHSISVF